MNIHTTQVVLKHLLPNGSAISADQGPCRFVPITLALSTGSKVFTTLLLQVKLSMLTTFSLKQSKKYAILIAAFFIVATAASIIALVSQKSQTETPQPSPQTVTKEQLITKLPYITSDFSVVYSEDQNQIYVNILKTPYEENRQKALDWLSQQGANPSSLNLIFTPTGKFK